MPELKPRIYQETIAATAARNNTLVVLPTGLGKTHIAMMLAQHRLKHYPQAKVVVLAPTKPLVDQHATSFANYLPDAESLGVTLTGKIAPKKRAEEFERASFIFCTPQTLENDLLGARVSLKDVCLLVVDEAHRAVGDYAYVFIAGQYQKQSRHERILALTASPGSKREQIQEVIDNCGIEKVEVRSQDDPDVKPYVQEMDIKHVEVDFPSSFMSIKTAIERVIKNRLAQVRRHGHIRDSDLNKTQLLMATKQLQGEIKSGQPDPLVWRSISLLAEVMKVQHALELIETQGVDAFLSYISSLQRQAEKGQSKAVKNLVEDADFKHAVILARKLQERKIEHPKLLKLLSMIRLELTKNKDAKIIVFNQYRDQAQRIVDLLKARARLFVGQQKKGGTGLSQKEQKEMLDAFRAGEFPILVATSVGEEGLDIPAVDLVVFYEPIPSAIRTIQRRGRTGRQETGRVYILVAKGTRDVGYRWSAHHKEQRMYRELKQIAKSVTPSKPKDQSVLDDFESKEELIIYADSREKGSQTLKELHSLGANLVLKSLPVGDYLLSKRLCVEYKNAEDFVNSLLDGRLMAQMGELTQYQKPVLLVEGTDLYAQRNVHPNAIRGALSAIAVSFGVPIIFAQDAQDAANILLTMARREKQGGISSQELGVTKPASEKEELLRVVAQLPNVGPVLAPKLLERFGTLKDLTSATKEQLLQIDGVGKKKADELLDVFSRRF